MRAQITTHDVTAPCLPGSGCVCAGLEMARSGGGESLSATAVLEGGAADLTGFAGALQANQKHGVTTD